MCKLNLNDTIYTRMMLGRIFHIPNIFQVIVAENISEMGLLHLVVQVTSLLQLVQGGRWVFLGGFTGLEEGGDRVGEINTDNDVDGGVEDDAGDDVEDGFENFCSFCGGHHVVIWLPKASGHVELLELSGNNANQEKSKFGDRFLNNTSFELMFQSCNVQNESKIEIFEDCFFRFEWCSGNFSKAPIDLGGHTMSEVGIQLKSNSILHNPFLTQIKTFRFKLVLVPNI